MCSCFFLPFFLNSWKTNLPCSLELVVFCSCGVLLVPVKFCKASVWWNASKTIKWSFLVWFWLFFWCLYLWTLYFNPFLKAKILVLFTCLLFLTSYTSKFSLYIFLIMSFCYLLICLIYFFTCCIILICLIFSRFLLHLEVRILIVSLLHCFNYLVWFYISKLINYWGLKKDIQFIP